MFIGKLKLVIQEAGVRMRELLFLFSVVVELYNRIVVIE